jgi:hypothetical protein
VRSARGRSLLRVVVANRGDAPVAAASWSVEIDARRVIDESNETNNTRRVRGR